MTKGLEELNPGVDKFRVDKKVYYREQNNEVLTSLRAYAADIPIVYKGPTGSGKTTLAAYICYLLGIGFGELKKNYGKELSRNYKDAEGSPLSTIEKKIQKFNDNKGFPLVTIGGHEDLDADSLKGRPYAIGENAYWLNGPAKLAAQYGGIFYFDEPAEARADTRVIMHSLSDHRRTLPIEGLGEIVEAHESFGFIMTYNDKYIDRRKRFKPSTSQRFVHIPISYPIESVETEIVGKKTGIDASTARMLVGIARDTRNMADQKTPGIEEGASPREVINAANMIMMGEDPINASLISMAYPITDNPAHIESIRGFIKNKFKEA